MPKPSKVFSISRAERTELQRWRGVRNTPHSLAQRARLILLLADGVAPVDVMATVDVTRPTVFKWRKRFEQDGVDGLLDQPRPGQPRKLTEKKIKEVLRLTVDYIPREATHWSTRLMAKYADITQYQVREIWKAADLRPHRLKTFKISNDPQFAEKVIDVVSLYMNPPDNAMVLSVDEKTQIQALDHTQPMLPLRPGQIERRTHDYTRHGTASLYAAFDIASGEIMGRVTRRHRAKEFLAFLRQIDKAVPDELDVHLILDNSSTHKTKAVQRWLTARPRFHTHFTPTSASWLNAVEGWFAQLERRALQRGTFTSVAELREAIRQFIKAHNVETAKPFRWTASANAIIAATNRAKQHAAA
ncbi:MAG: IS630 family transposase [Woeseiaceae bacterium]|nr:IS630 family transposase [Woeseiaceae bacterium]